MKSKYTYTIKEIELQGRKIMNICLEEGLESISVFLNHDISSENGAKLYIETMKKVLNGDLGSPYTLSGNSCLIILTPDIAQIEEKYMSKRVVSIETEELILLMEDFIEEKKIKG